MNNALLFMCLMGTLMYFFYLLLCKCFQQRFRPGLRLNALGLSHCLLLFFKCFQYSGTAV